MAKEEKEKKAFAWDSQEVIKEIEVGEKEKRTISICTLNGKTFVVDSKSIYTQKDGWKTVKNQTFEIGLFLEISDTVQDWVELKAGK